MNPEQNGSSTGVPSRHRKSFEQGIASYGAKWAIESSRGLQNKGFGFQPDRTAEQARLCSFKDRPRIWIIETGRELSFEENGQISLI